MSSKESSMIREYLRSMKGIHGFEKKTLEQKRQEYAVGMMKTIKLPEGTSVEKTKVANLPAEWVRAANVPEESGQVILYFHGGSFFAGSCDTHRGLAASISEAGGARVLVVEYRLAPEHKYPAANEDCLAAYRWLIENGICSKDIVIGGESVGATLTLMTLLSLREAGGPLPAAAFMLSLFGDVLNFDGESYTTRAELDPVSSIEASEADRGYYIDSATMAVKPPVLSPIRQNLSGLPSLFIQAADHEIVLSDSLRLAERAREAGLDVTLEVWDEMWHCFQAFSAIVPEAKQAVDHIGQFVKKHIGSAAVV